MKFIVLVTFLLAFTLTQTQDVDFNILDSGCLTQTVITREECNKRTAVTPGLECCLTSGNQGGEKKTSCYAVKKNETSLNNFYTFLKALEISSISILCASSYVKIATIAFTSLFFLF